MDAEFGVPEPAILEDFYQEIGLTGGPGNWGGSEQPDQIRIVEAPYRQLRSMRIGCESEEDLTIAANNLDGLARILHQLPILPEVWVIFGLD